MSDFFRFTVYIPLGGNRKGTARTCLDLMIVFLLTGLWHGPTLPYLLFGVWNGALVVLERITGLHACTGKEGPRKVLVWLAMGLGFTLFCAPDLNAFRDLFRFIPDFACLAAAGTSAAGNALLFSNTGVLSLYSLIPVLVFLLLILLVRHSRLPAWARRVLLLLLLALSLIRLTAGGWTPFLYGSF